MCYLRYYLSKILFIWTYFNSENTELFMLVYEKNVFFAPLYGRNKKLCKYFCIMIYFYTVNRIKKHENSTKNLNWQWDRFCIYFGNHPLEIPLTSLIRLDETNNIPS